MAHPVSQGCGHAAASGGLQLGRGPGASVGLALAVWLEDFELARCNGAAVLLAPRGGLLSILLCVSSSLKLSATGAGVPGCPALLWATVGQQAGCTSGTEDSRASRAAL